ncbi:MULTISPECIES: hypothetical protein [unclassified Frankia]|uniref:hypothetical protein n=1 Tax=unclassified Frankia TaxID=2632575 RepID=UPI002AD51818|nr:MULTISPECIES: hypothetical protein [unclassified Frankia]
MAVLSKRWSSKRWSSKRWSLAAATLMIIAATGVTGGQALAGANQPKGAAAGLGPLRGLLPRDHLTLESALQVDLSKESVRLPIYKGKANGTTVWFTLLDASDEGLARDLGVNYAPKLTNLAVGCQECVQTVTLDAPTPQQNRFGQAVVNFQGAPDFSPTRVAEPGPDGFPLAKFAPGAVAGPGYSPFIRLAGSNVVYSAPIVATGDGPFDVVHHTDTGDRVLGIHIAPPSPPGQYLESYVDMLFVKGFDAGKPIVYISTDAGQPLTAALERATYVPALDKAAYNGGDDFLGSARERLFGFINGQTGADNSQAQGFVHLAKDGHVAEDASAGNTALIDALRNGGDLLNVFGDFPTETDPRHALAYSPLWDAQLGLWTDKAVRQGLNKRQIDEVQVFNLAASRPDLLTGVDPATGQPAPYGSVGVDINCAVIGFMDTAPTANLADPLPNSQFPPR